MVTFELFWAFFELFFVRLYWEIPVLIITFWTQFFITIKHLAVFWRSYLNTETLEIFLLLKHFSCWLSAPYFGKLYGSRQIQDIHCMKELFCKIFVLNISVFCTFSFFAEDCKMWGTALSTRFTETYIAIPAIQVFACNLTRNSRDRKWIFL